MKILLFGGTTEGRKLSQKLCQRNFQVTCCVATAAGKAQLPTLPNLQVLVGRLDETEILSVLQRDDFRLVVDATHPYAQKVSEAAAKAALALKLPYWRVLRPASDLSGCILAKTVAQACSLAAPGNVLAATGSKQIAEYCCLPNWESRLFARVLPEPESLALCRAAGLQPWQILPGKGPFTLQENLQLMRRYQIATLVTKDGGAAGGFLEKKKAAQLLNIRCIVIGRPLEKQTGMTVEQVLEKLDSLMGVS